MWVEAGVRGPHRTSRVVAEELGRWCRITGSITHSLWSREARQHCFPSHVQL